jgi:Protein of unknown function (DUF2393)
MGGLLQPSPEVVERDTSRRTIVIAIAVVVAVAGLVAVLLRSKPKPAFTPPPYAAKLLFSQIKLSQAQNFVGGIVTYVDGTLTNTGDKTVTSAIVRVTFKDLYNQVAQVEEVPARVLRATEPYPDAVDLSLAPLAPGKSKPFRLTFEHVSEQWNQSYPELQITSLTLK